MTPAQAIEPPSSLVERALAAASGQECIVVVEDVANAHVRFANNTVTTNGIGVDRHVSVAVFKEVEGGKAVGLASASGLQDIVDLVDQARADADDGTAAEDASELVGGGADRDFEESASGVEFAVFSDLLEHLGGAFERARSKDHVLAGFANDDVATISLGSSTGLRRRFVQSTGSIEVVARDHDGRRSAWVGQGTEDFSTVDFASIESKLTDRLAWAEKSVELPAGRYEVLLPPDAVADLVIVLAEALSGRDADDGWNVFSGDDGQTRIGEQLSPQPFVLRSDPNAPGLSSLPFVVAPASSTDASVFDNGAPIDPVDFIAEGVLRRLRYHRAGARRAGRSFTPGGDNLILEVPGASPSLSDLIASTTRGLLLTCLWYIREVDVKTLLLTGLTRDGVFLVEDGEVVGQVNNFRFNESPVDLLRHTLEVGSSERAMSREWGEWMSRTAMPALRVENFNMSTVSRAR